MVTTTTVATTTTIAPTGGGGGGGGGYYGPNTNYIETPVVSFETIALNQNLSSSTGSNTYEITLKNSGNRNMTCWINQSGLPTGWFVFSDTKILSPGETAIMKYIINVPENSTYKVFELTLRGGVENIIAIRSYMMKLNIDKTPKNETISGNITTNLTSNTTTTITGPTGQLIAFAESQYILIIVAVIILAALLYVIVSLIRK
jgi:hypothetical protein